MPHLHGKPGSAAIREETAEYTDDHGETHDPYHVESAKGIKRQKSSAIFH